MAIKIGTQVDVGPLKALEKTIDGVVASMKRLVSQQGKSAQNTKEYKALAATLKTANAEVKALSKSIDALQKAQPALEKLSVPFTELTKNGGKLVNLIGKVYRGLDSLNTVTDSKLGSKAFMNQYKGLQANLALQEKINQETAKLGTLQAQLYSKGGKIPGTRAGGVAENTLKNIRLAQGEVAKLKAQLTSLEATDAKNAAAWSGDSKAQALIGQKTAGPQFVQSLKLMANEQGRYNRELLKGEQAAQRMLGVQTAGAATGRAIVKQLNARTTAQATLSKELLKGEEAAQKMLGIQTAGSTVNASIAKQLNERTTSQGKLNKELLKGEEAAQKMLGIQTAGKTAGAAIVKQLNERTTAQAALNKELLKGEAAAQKMLGVQTAGKTAGAAIAKQLNDRTKAQASLNKELLKGEQAAQKMLGVQTAGTTAGRAIVKQMRDRVNAQAEVNRATMKGEEAARRLIGSQSSNASQHSVIARQMQDRVKAENSLMRAMTARVRVMKAATEKSTSSSASAELARVKAMEASVKHLQSAMTAGTATPAHFNAVNKLLDEMPKKFNAVSASSKTSSKTTLDWGKNMKYAIGGVARSMGAMTYSYASLAPLLAGIAFGTAIKKVYELGEAFEYTTVYVDALGDSLDGIKASGIQDALLNLDTQRKGPQDLAEGMKEFAKAGVDAAESLGQIEQMAKFASVAEMELGEAVKLTVGQSKAFGESYVASANMIASAALSSATDIQELGTALSYTTELATVSGVKFEEVATAMAAMANSGIRGSKAGTAIRTSMLRLQNPSTKLKGMLDDLGISWSAFTEGGQVKDMTTAFQELKRVTDNLPDKDRIAVLKELFGLRALKGGANVLRMQGAEWDNLLKKIKAAGDGLEYVDGVYQKLEDTVTAKKQKLSSEFQKSLLQAFDPDAMKSILDDLTKIVSSEGFISGITATVDAINLLAKSITFLFSSLGDIRSLGVNILDEFLPVPAEWLTFNPLLELVKSFREVEDAKKELTKSQPLQFEVAMAEIPINDITAQYKKLEELYQSASELRFEQDWFESDKDWAARVEESMPKAAFFEQYFQKIEIPVPLVPEIKDKGIESEILEITSKLEKLYDTRGESALTVGLEKDLEALREKLSAEQKQLIDTLESLPIVARSSFKAFREEMKFDMEFETLEGPEKLAAEAHKMALEWNNSLDEPLKESSKVIKDLSGTIREELIKKGLRLLKQEASELDFSIITGNLRATTDDSKQLINGLNADLLDMKNEVYSKFREMGMATREITADGGVEFKFSAEAQQHLEKMVENSRMFSDAIKEAKDNVKELQHTIQDTKFDFNTDMFSEKMKLQPSGVDEKSSNFNFQLKQLQSLKASAKAAASAGHDGWERQLELLKQAYGIAKSMDASKDADGLKTKMEIAKSTMKKYENSLTSLRAKSKQQYLAAKKAYEAAERGDVDQNMQKRKINEMSALQKKILEVENTRKAAAQKELQSIEELAGKSSTAWGDAKTATEEAGVAAEDYGKYIKTIGETWTNSAATAVAAVNRITKALEEAATAQKNLGNIPTGGSSGSSSSSGGQEARAAGGPVSAGQPYLVGEKGREMFMPSVDGYIVPNHKLQRSEETVNVNLNIGDENISLTGRPSEVQKFQRANLFNQKFASA